MSRNNLLKRINRALSPNKVDFSAIDSEVAALKKKLEETVNIQTVDDVKSELNKFKKKIDLTPILSEVNKIGDIFNQKVKELQEQIDTKATELEYAKATITTNDIRVTNRFKTLSLELASLKSKLAELEVFRDADLTSLNQTAEEIKSAEKRLNRKIDELTSNSETFYTKKSAEVALKNAKDELDKLRLDLLTRISGIHGGGNANRQMFIGGADPLKRYTDMNLKAGTNVTITYANNDQTKKVDVTFTATGTGGSVRSINSIATDTSAGDTSGTDYVYLCTGTLDLTMPDATGNTNLYTIKNVGTGTVTIKTTSAQTIDGQATIVMPTQFTSVDLISDTANWNIT